MPSGDIIALGVIQRIGEGIVAMMAQMELAIDFVGQPKPERGLAKRVVEPADAGRVAVDDLVLQAAMKDHSDRAQKQQESPGQHRVVPGQQHEQEINPCC